MKQVVNGLLYLRQEDESLSIDQSTHSGTGSILVGPLVRFAYHNVTTLRDIDPCVS
jgi:hypothetical protein